MYDYEDDGNPYAPPSLDDGNVGPSLALTFSDVATIRNRMGFVALFLWITLILFVGVILLTVVLGELSHSGYLMFMLLGSVNSIIVVVGSWRLARAIDSGMLAHILILLGLLIPYLYIVMGLVVYFQAHGIIRRREAESSANF